MLQINGALIQSQDHNGLLSIDSYRQAQNMVKVKELEKEKLDNGSTVNSEYPFEKITFRFIC